MFDKQLTFVENNFTDKFQAIDFLVQAAKKAGKLTNYDSYKKSVLKREEEFSTAIGYGVAIPHGSCDDVKESFVAVATLKGNMQWGEETVQMIFMIGVPESKRTKEHLQILAWLSKNLMHEDFRNSIVSAKDKVELFNCLNKLER